MQFVRSFPKVVVNVVDVVVASPEAPAGPGNGVVDVVRAAQEASAAPGKEVVDNPFGLALALPPPLALALAFRARVA